MISLGFMLGMALIYGLTLHKQLHSGAVVLIAPKPPAAPVDVRLTQLNVALKIITLLLFPLGALALCSVPNDKTMSPIKGVPVESTLEEDLEDLGIIAERNPPSLYDL